MPQLNKITKPYQEEVVTTAHKIPAKDITKEPQQVDNRERIHHNKRTGHFS